jgi:hypothetical protein
LIKYAKPNQEVEVVRYNREFVVTVIVITEFDCILISVCFKVCLWSPVTEKENLTVYLKDTFGIFLELIPDSFVVVKPSQDLVPFVNVQKSEVVFLNLEKQQCKGDKFDEIMF